MLGFAHSRSLGTLLALSSFALVPLACGDASDNGAPGGGATLTSADAGSTGSNNASIVPLSDGERFLTEYASAVCAMYQPCCNAAELGFDAGGCTEWFAKVTAAYLPEAFQPEAGAECLRAVAEARAEDPDRCSHVASFEEATLRHQCEQAFKAPARDGAPLGGSCLLAGDCAASGEEGGQIICYGRRCVLERRGASGDGPCYAGGNVELEQEMFTCDAADGVYCHRADNVCAPRVGAGEYCPYGNACDADSMCIGGTCRALPERGESCLNAIPGAGGFCRSGDACDVPTLTCGPGLAMGTTCTEGAPGQCASGVCDRGVCVDTDFSRHLNCTGGAR
jgi:hypothetical protein